MAKENSLTGLQVELAVAFSGRNRTLYEAAVAVGRKSGDVQKTVHRMHGDGWLLADSEELGQGTQFWLNPSRLHQIEAAIARAQPSGALVAGQRTLRVRGGDRAILYATLAHEELSMPVVWAVELDGAEALLLVLDRNSTLLQAERLKAGLEAAGLECESGRVGERVDGRTLRVHAASVLAAHELGQKSRSAPR